MTCGECMITLSLPRSGACNLAILNCAPVFALRLLLAHKAEDNDALCCLTQFDVVFRFVC